MANFRRRRPRASTHHTMRGSSASWRAKHGFKPVRVTAMADVSYWDRPAWLAAWQEHRKQWDHPKGKSYLGQMNNNPAWWDRVFHTRPKRCATKRLERKVLKDQIDPDDTAWPVASRRPTNYFW